MNSEIAEQVRTKEAGPPAAHRLMPSLSDMAAHQRQAAGKGNREEALFAGGCSFADAADIYRDKQNILAQDVQFAPIPTLVPSPEQLGLGPLIDAVGHAAGEAVQRGRDATAKATEQAWNPYRYQIDDTMNTIPEKAWTRAYEAFPQFKQAGLSERQTIEVMKAIVRNELYNYDALDKSTDDDVFTGTEPALSKIHYKSESRLTLGLAQLSTDAVREREAEYPKQVNFEGHEEQALMQPVNAPLLVAATLAHNVDMYRRHHVPITERSLGYSYNPPNKRILPSAKDLVDSVHARNVMHQLAIIRGQIEPKPDER